MTNLASFSALNEYVNRIRNEENLDMEGEAFIYLGLNTILRINEDEITDAITDGHMDGEVDAIYIEERIVHIFTFKYTSKFANTKKNYPGSELDQFILTVDQIISGNLDKKTVNTAIWDKYKEVLSLTENGRVDFKIHIVSNKLKPVEHARLKLENTIDKFRILHKPFYYDQEDIVSLILENKVVKISGGVRFVDTQHFEKSDGNIRTVIGVIGANDLIRLMQSDEDKDKINEDIFNENVRVYRPKHRVNKAIIESALSDSNYQFFYLNNGITILCEDCDYTPNKKSPYVKLKNVQIINGGQTSHSLFECYRSDPLKLETIEILIRICIAKKNDPISDLISETSNSQIPIGSRDLHSNDQIQRKIEQELLALGYYYERKPNQFVDKLRAKRLNNELLGQIYMAYHFDMPSEAKNSKSLVFGNMYEEIFDDSKITGKELLKLYNIYLPILERKKEVQRKKRKKEPVIEKEAFITRATFHILNVIKFIIEDRVQRIENRYNIEIERDKAIDKLFENDIESITEKAIEYINEVVVDEMKLRGDLYTHDNFFKELGTSTKIRTYVLNKLKNTV